MIRKLKNEELNRLSVDNFKESEKIPLVIVLDNVRSLNNIGSIFRTADAFLVDAIYLCGITACPPHKDIQKTALGATESVRWKYFPTTLEAVKELKADGFSILGIEQAEQRIFLNDFNPETEKKYALLFGHEVFGVEEAVMNEIEACIEIPQFGTKHSLNIAVSAGIVIWDFLIKIKSQA